MKARVSRIVLSLHAKTNLAPNKIDIAYGDTIKWFARHSEYDDDNIEAVILLKLRKSLE